MADNVENHIQYTECFVAFIDILGFSKLVERSEEEPSILAVLTQALNAMSELPSGTKESRYVDQQGNTVEGQWRVQTRPFSDCIVLFMPTFTGSLSQILFMIRYLHDRMLEFGLCMRGAVTIGGMYWNEAWSVSDNAADRTGGDQGVLWRRGVGRNFPVTLGPGLIEAHRLETECAIYPRILVSRAVHEYTRNEHLTCAPLGPYQPADRPLTDFIRSDADGMLFLDLLHSDITRNDTERIVRTEGADGSFTVRWERDGNTHGRVMQNVRALIADRDRCPDRIRAKHEWLKTYADCSDETRRMHGGS